MTVHAPRHSSVDTRDIDEAHAMIASVYVDNQLKISGPTEGFRFEQSRLDLGDIRLDRYHTTLTTEYHLDPFGHVLVARVVEGTIDNVSGGVDRRLGPGDVYLAARPDDPQFTRLRGARVELTALELPLLTALDPDGCTDRVARLDLRALSPGATRQWQRNLDFVTGLATSHPAMLSPLTLGAAGRLLAASFLDAFAPETTDEPSRDRRDAAPEVVRRALDFIEANADLDIGPADIARAAFVGVRALQLAFRRHLDTTPMTALRTARLARAHDDLTAADPTAGVTVAEISARWGFSNSTRFASLYRATYGSTPGMTLRT